MSGQKIIDGLNEALEMVKATPTDNLEAGAGDLVEQATHLLDWLPGAYDHCKYGSREWCDGYLSNAVDVIRSQAAQLAAVTAERDDYLQSSLAHDGQRQIEQERADHAEAQLKAAREALEMIAGIRPCLDNLMGNSDIARTALSLMDSKGEKS